ncbi:MAG: ribosome maturation factor RimP [Acidimicrobiales bacterium]|nr:MAG: ribosome maturation factor RimP [Acidimicrobiales bacterium]
MRDLEAAQQIVRRLAEPIVSAEGGSIFDVEVRPGLVRVLVERAGGIDVETLAEVSRALSRELDASDVVSGRYVLEVSSPGLERQLRRREHFLGAVGEQVTVRTTGPEGVRRLSGVLEAAGDDHIVVRSAEGVAEEIAYGQIDTARTVFEWGPPAGSDKGGSGRSGGASRKQRGATGKR